MMSLLKWFCRFFTGQPHFVIGDQGSPYMLRWYLTPRNPYLNLYLHKFLRDDEDRALHDHPWWFWSIMIWGGYKETIADGSQIVRTAPSIVFREATHRHRVILNRDAHGDPVPCWTIILTGPKEREWGFWCPKGFVVWTDFVDRTNHGSTGRGCQ